MALNPKLILASNDIQYNTKTAEKGWAPISILIVILVLYVFVANWNTLLTQRIAKIMDISLLLLMGIGGALVLYMSQFSLHTACHENYNLIWLHPLYLIAVPLYFISKKWTGYLGYLFFTVIVLFMMMSHWIPQHFSNAVIVLMMMVLFLQIRLIRRGKHAKYD
jgi:hypothetical protein